MKRRILSFLPAVFLVMALAAAGCMTGCSQKKADDQKEEKVDTYQFVDVLGKQYEAVLLKEVPKHTYDYSRLGTQNGYRYYTDKNGRIISKLGVDVSRFQEKVDWVKVKASGIDFAMIRLGYRGYGKEGRLAEDQYFKKNIEGALAAGLDVGVYFFSQALDETEVREEAAFVLERIQDYQITYPVVFDTEEIKDAEARTDGMEKEQVTENCAIFCETVQKAGYTPMIYANMKWMAFTLDLTKLTDYDKWYADYEDIPQCPYEFSMWQYTEKGKVPGIDGYVDLNVDFVQE